MGKGVRDMEEEWIICGRGGVRTIEPGGKTGRKSPQPAETHAACAGQERIYCACGSRICLLCRNTLEAACSFEAGPGVCSLALSPDGACLYALCAGADSVLMLDAHTGEQQIICRAGMNPPAMVLDETGNVLAVAGGEVPEVMLFSARTLRLFRRIAMPGPVCAVVLLDGAIAALCLSETLGSLLVIADERGVRCMQALEGMPGALCVQGGALLCGTQGWLSVVAHDGRVMYRIGAPGRAAQIAFARNILLWRDDFSEALYALRGGRWRLLARDVLHIAPFACIHRG